MHYDAALRVRELTQNIYDIGDEIADYINHVSQAIADWDADLVEDCLLELEEIVAEGRAEVRPGLSELNGLRQAFVSGVRAGSMSGVTPSRTPRALGGSVARGSDYPHPGRTLSFMRSKPGASAHRSLNDATAPTTPGASDPRRARGAEFAEASAEHAPATMASTASWRMWLREQAERIRADLREVEDWVINQTQCALESQSVLLPQAYVKAEQRAIELVGHWREVIARQPELAAGMRGEAPPEFLAERARVEEIVGRLQRRKRGTAV